MRNQDEMEAVQAILRKLRSFAHESSLSEFAISRRIGVMLPTLTAWQGKSKHWRRKLVLHAQRLSWVPYRKTIFGTISFGAAERRN
jgi:7-cyano-7-deazaguanine synthase in queuosine biosynthesis